MVVVVVVVGLGLGVVLWGGWRNFDRGVGLQGWFQSFEEISFESSFPSS